ncbi:MAG: urease accessory protein UreD [Pseudomonadota bacterium]
MQPIVDPAATSPLRPLQRVRGAARVALKAGAQGTRLAGLHQAGSAKAMLPRCHGTRPEVVLLNTAGGVTGGDRLDYNIELQAQASAVATTQTAERAYASAGGSARVGIEMRLGRDAALDWLPQETILFDGCALDRTTNVHLDRGARLLYCETVVLGRAAMGERVSKLALMDRRTICRSGKPVVIDPVRLDSATLSAPGKIALLDGCRAFATILLVADGAEDALAPVRNFNGPDGVDIGSSAWDGKCVIRLMAADAWPLRRALVGLLTQLRGSPMPRVWQT